MKEDESALLAYLIISLPFTNTWQRKLLPKQSRPFGILCGRLGNHANVPRPFIWFFILLLVLLPSVSWPISSSDSVRYLLCDSSFAGGGFEDSATGCGGEILPSASSPPSGSKTARQPVNKKVIRFPVQLSVFRLCRVRMQSTDPESGSRVQIQSPHPESGSRVRIQIPNPDSGSRVRIQSPDPESGSRVRIQSLDPE